MNCRVCEYRELRDLWKDCDGFQWRKCTACCSDTSEAIYDPSGYDAGYVAKLLADEKGLPVENHTHNGAAFARHAPKPGRFLDVGTGHGASQTVMRSLGWTTYGFDVSAQGRPGEAVIAPVFQASLFATRFEAVLAREVLEHVEDGKDLLYQLREVLMPGGLLQITTPRPIETGNEMRCYQRAHLVLWDPACLRGYLGFLGFEVEESEVWQLGQRYTVRKSLWKEN